MQTATRKLAAAVIANVEAASVATNACELHAFRQAAAFAADAFREYSEGTTADARLEKQVEDALDTLTDICGDFRALHGESRYVNHRRELANMGIVIHA